MKEIPNSFLIEYHDPFSVWSEIESSMQSLLPLSLDVTLDQKSAKTSASCLYISSKKLEECGRMSTLHFFSEHPYLHLFIIPPMHSGVYKEIKDDIKAWVKEKKTEEWLIIYGLCKREFAEDQKINSKTIEKIKRKLLSMGHRSTRLLLAPMVNLRCLKSTEGKHTSAADVPRISDSPPESTIHLYKDWDDIKSVMKQCLKEAIEDRFSDVMNSIEKYKYRSIYVRRDSTEMSHNLKMANLKENLLHLYLKCGLIYDCINGYSELLSGKLARHNPPKDQMMPSAHKERTAEPYNAPQGQAGLAKETFSPQEAKQTSLDWSSNRKSYSMESYPSNGEISQDIFPCYTKFRVSLPITRVSPFQFRCYILAKQLVALWTVNTLDRISKSAELAMEFAMQKVEPECKGMFVKFLFHIIYHIESKLAHSQETTTPVTKTKGSLASSALLDCSDSRIRCYRCLAFLYKIVHALETDRRECTTGMVDKEDDEHATAECPPTAIAPSDIDGHSGDSKEVHEPPKDDLNEESPPGDSTPLDSPPADLKVTLETAKTLTAETKAAENEPVTFENAEQEGTLPEDGDEVDAPSDQNAPACSNDESDQDDSDENEQEDGDPSEQNGDLSESEGGQEDDKGAAPASSPFKTPEMDTPPSHSLQPDESSSPEKNASEGHSGAVEDGAENIGEEPTEKTTNESLKDIEDSKSVSCATDCSINISEIGDYMEIIRKSVNENKQRVPENIPKFAFEICLPIKVMDGDKSNEASPKDEVHSRKISTLKPKHEFDDLSELLERSCTYFTLGGLYRHSVLVDPAVKHALSKLNMDSVSNAANGMDKELNGTIHSGDANAVDTNLAFLEKDTRMMGWTSLWSIVKSAMGDRNATPLE